MNFFKLDLSSTIASKDDAGDDVDPELSGFYDLCVDKTQQVERQKKSNPFGLTIKRTTKRKRTASRGEFVAKVAEILTKVAAKVFAKITKVITVSTQP